MAAPLEATKLSFPEDATITQLLLEWNPYQMSRDKAAIIDGISGRTIYTHSSFRDSVKKLATYLQSRYCLKSDAVVCILMRNSLHYALLVHAILACGDIVSALNPDYQLEDLQHALNLAQPDMIIVDETLEDKLNGCMQQLKEGSTVITFQSLNICKILAETNVSQWQAPNIAATQQAFLCFSSGTTGSVKGVKLSHRNIVANLFQHRQALQGDFDENSVFVLVLPYFHILGLGVFVCQYALQGFPTVVFPRFDFKGMLESIARDKVTHINVVPTLALEFIRNPAANSGNYKTVKCLMNAAAPLKQDIADQISSRLSCIITQWYGMTEASPSVISQSQSQVHVRNSVGKLLPGIQLRVLDENGFDCSRGRAGELCIRGPNVMLGYVGPPELTEAAMTSDGFMRTGDVGYVNEQGFVFLVDRVKEMIKVKGNQIAPAELEGILLSHPSVTDAAVRGYYVDRDATEYAVGFITTPQPPSRHSAIITELHKLVENRVARYKRLSGGIYVTAEIPRNASGIILRRKLPDMSLAAAAATVSTSRL